MRPEQPLEVGGQMPFPRRPRNRSRRVREIDADDDEPRSRRRRQRTHRGRQLRGLDRAFRRAERIHEREHDGPAAEGREAHRPPALVAEPEQRRLDLAALPRRLSVQRRESGTSERPRATRTRCAGARRWQCRRRRRTRPRGRRSGASDFVAAARRYRPPDPNDHEHSDGQKEREQGRGEERCEHQVSLGRRSRTPVRSSVGSSRRYAATSTAIVNGTDAGTHMIPAASCWSASADSPPGRCASAA